MPPGRPLRVFQPTKRNMTKYSVRTGKHAGTSYLSLGKFVYHKYNYVVTGSHINDISRHFTPKLIRYLRNFFKSHKCWNQFIPRDNSFRCGPRVYMWMFSLVFFWIPHIWAISKPEARRDLHRATRLSCTSGVCAGPRRTSMVSTRWKSFLRLLSSWRYSEFQSGAFYFCVNFYGIWNIPYD